VLWAPDKRNAAVPQCCEMLHSLADSILVIDADTPDARNLRCAIEKHNWKAVNGKVLYDRFLDAKREGRYSINAALNHPTYDQFHAAPIVGSRTEQDFVTVLDSKTLEGLHDLCKEGICEL